MILTVNEIKLLEDFGWVLESQDSLVFKRGDETMNTENVIRKEIEDAKKKESDN